MAGTSTVTVTSVTNVDIPAGFGIPLVNLNTDLFPAPTMTALDSRYGGAGGDNAFEYIQSTPLATWVIAVPGVMGRRPNVDIYIANELVEADVVASTTQVTITFPSPQSGSAVLS